MNPECAREALRQKFREWLETQYSTEALRSVDIVAASMEWVKETGEFIPGTGLCVFEHCALCNQFPKVLESGMMSALTSEPHCHNESLRPLIPVSQGFVY